MRISRTLTLTAATAATALTLSAVPAQAASLSPTTVADAYSVMLTPAQAKLVGIGKQRVSNFGVANSTKGSPNAPWLCELSGDTAIEGKGAQDLISSQVLSLSGENVTAVAQEIHWYANEKQAKKAYDGLVSKIKGCDGQHTLSTLSRKRKVQSSPRSSLTARRRPKMATRSCGSTPRQPWVTQPRTLPSTSTRPCGYSGTTSRSWTWSPRATTHRP